MFPLAANKNIFFFHFLGVQCKSNKQSVHEGNKKAKFFLGKDFKEKIFSLQFYVTIGAFSLRPCILLPKHRLWPKYKSILFNGFFTSTPLYPNSLFSRQWLHLQHLHDVHPQNGRWTQVRPLFHIFDTAILSKMIKHDGKKRQKASKESSWRSFFRHQSTAASLTAFLLVGI